MLVDITWRFLYVISGGFFMSFFIKLYSLCKQKRQFAYFFAILLAAFVLVSNGLIVQAADFKHNHTSSCYRTGTGPCTSAHSTSTRTESSTKHCYNCGAQRAHTVYVYWDRCHGLGQDYELGGYHVCKTCGSTGHAWGSTSAGTHMVSQQILSCGKNNSATGTLWIKNSDTNWTKEDVIIEAGVTIHNNSLTMSAQPYSWDGQSSWTTESTKQVSDNGTYSVYAKSNDGTVIAESIVVNNIDRTGPVLGTVEKNMSEWTNQDVLISLYAEDLQPDGSKGCGVAEAPYSYDGGTTYVVDNTLTVSANGIYDVQLIDLLGNVGNTCIEINNIDKEAPAVIEISQVNEGWQSKSVFMKVVAEDVPDGSGLHNAPYSMDGINWQETPEFIFTENGTYTVYVRDVAGNGNSYEFVVDKIDVTAPVIESVSAISDKIWTDKVEVTINAIDLQPDGSEGSGLDSLAYSIDGGNTWQESNVFLVESDVTYDIRVRDVLLWESEEYIVERSDLPYPKPSVNDTSDNDTSSGSVNPNPDIDTSKEILEIEEENDTEIDANVTDDNDSKHTDVNGGYNTFNTAVLDGLYTFGNMYDDARQVQTDTEEHVVEQTVEVEVTAGDNTQSVQVITMPWYVTTVGKTVIVSTSTLALGTLLGILVYMLLFSVKIYCVENDGQVHKLGRAYIHKTKEGYSLFITDLMLMSAPVPKYRIKVSKFLLKYVENACLLVQSSEKNLEVLMQESIDFEL